MKRFYREAIAQEVDGGWQVALDGRLVKTQRGAPQLLQSERLADLLAREWAEQGEEFTSSDLPLRDLADVAIDIIAPARADAIGKLLTYADTDTLCYRAEPDEPLFHRQREVWEPIVERLEKREGIRLTRVHGIVHKPLPPESMERLGAKLEAHSDFALSGLTTMASLAASLCIALEALEDGADGEALWSAANLEEEWQIEQWGEDAQAAERTAKRKRAFLTAMEFTRAAS